MAVTANPQAGTNTQVTTGDSPVVAVPAGASGGYIVNPLLASDQGLGSSEPLYVDPVGDAPLQGNGTVSALQPGQSFSIIPNSSSPVMVNAQSNGHKFTAVWWVIALLFILVHPAFAQGPGPVPSGAINSGVSGQVPYYAASGNILSPNPNISVNGGALTLGQSGVQGSTKLNGASSGTITVQPPAAAGINTLTLPAATDTLVGRATTDTLTNKSVDGSEINSGTVVAARMPAGVDANVVSSISGATTLSSANCGQPIFAGGNGFYAVTIGAASGFTANCKLIVKNTDTYGGPSTGRGKKIIVSGLANFVLYPRQTVTIRSVSAAWVSDTQNTPWTPQSPVTFYIDNAGSDAAGAADGLGTEASFQTLGHCAVEAYAVVYTSSLGNIICSPTAGQTFQEFVQAFFPLNGGGVLRYIGNGGQFIWKPVNSSYALEVGDGALVGVQSVDFNGASVTTPLGYTLGHQHGVLDIGTGVTVETAGLTLPMFSCDAEFRTNVVSGLTISNSGGSSSSAVFKGCSVGSFDLNGVFTMTGSPTFGRFAVLVSGTQLYIESGFSVSGPFTAGVSTITGNSVMNNLSGSTPPGGVPTPATGGQYCTSQC